MAKDIGAQIKTEGGKLIVEVPARVRTTVENVKANLGDQASRLKVASREIPTLKRPTLKAVADGGFRIGDSAIRLTGEQVKAMSDTQLKQLTRIAGLAEKSGQFERIMTDNRTTVRRTQTRVYEQMDRIERSNPKLENALAPLWKKIASAQEAADRGHSLARHGANLTDMQMQTRLTTGVAADGVFSPTPASTRINSDKDWVLTRDAALREVESKLLALGGDLSKPPQAGQPRSYGFRIEYNRAIDDGFVGDSSTQVIVTNPANPSKTGNGYTTFTPVDGITRSFTRVSWNLTSQKWEVVQHYPDAKGWNNATKAYDVTTPADVFVNLPK